MCGCAVRLPCRRRRPASPADALPPAAGLEGKAPRAAEGGAAAAGAADTAAAAGAGAVAAEPEPEPADSLAKARPFRFAFIAATSRSSLQCSESQPPPPHAVLGSCCPTGLPAIPALALALSFPRLRSWRARHRWRWRATARRCRPHRRPPTRRAWPPRLRVESRAAQPRGGRQRSIVSAASRPH
jgi:hypothetical protein